MCAYLLLCFGTHTEILEDLEGKNKGFVHFLPWEHANYSCAIIPDVFDTGMKMDNCFKQEQDDGMYCHREYIHFLKESRITGWKPTYQLNRRKT